MRPLSRLYVGDDSGPLVLPRPDASGYVVIGVGLMALLLVALASIGGR